MREDFDFVVVGSGFGGSVAALRLSEKGYRVCILERGKRYRPADFARTNWNLRRYLWMPLFKLFGIQNLSLFKNVLVLSGTGVGGGSLVYANTLLEPTEAFYQSPEWAGLANWKQELTPHFKTAKHMLGVTRNQHLTVVDEKLREVAAEMGKDQSFHSVDVGVFFNKPGEEGKQVSDPFFGGKGPKRSGCIFCGGCMVGCRHDAKNTLDKNYLYFAEQNGVEIRPESLVRDICPNSDGSYNVFVERSTAWFLKHPYHIRTRGVVVSAGVLGTVDLLLRCRDQSRSLRNISSTLGTHVRTNSEALVGVTTQDCNQDFSRGIAITSGFYPDKDTHIEPVRYSKGSSFMKVLAAPMVDDGGRISRPLKLIATCFLKPLETLWLLFNLKWAETTVILLIMQTLDNQMRFKLGRNLFTLFRKRLTTEVNPLQKVPSYIAIGHQVARRLARKLNAIPQSAVNEVMLQIPTTAHILGGCCIGSGPDTGVIDKNHEVFGYKNLYVCDGSVIPANLGVNPSLTITAMSERAMSFIPPKDGL